MSDDAPVAAEPEPAPPPLPRLRIQHLMLWTAIAAVLLGVERQAGNPDADLVLMATTVGSAVSASAAFLLLILLRTWKRRGCVTGGGLSLWLVVIVTLDLLDRLLTLGFFEASEGWSRGSSTLRFAFRACQCCVGFAAVGVGWRAWSDTDVRPWRCVFFVYTVGALLTLADSVGDLLFHKGHVSVLLDWFPIEEFIFWWATISFAHAAPIAFLAAWATLRSGRLRPSREWTTGVAIAAFVVYYAIKCVSMGRLVIEQRPSW